MRRLAIALLVFGLAGPALLAQPKKVEDPLITEFKKHIGSDDVGIRKDQVERLSKLQTPDAVAMLFQKGVTDSDAGVRERAAWSLSQMETPEARAAVLAGLESAKPEVREGVVLAIGLMKEMKDAPVDKIAAMLNDDRSDEVRLAAASTLGQIGNKSAVPALMKALATRDEAMLVALADALALLKDPASAPPLIHVLDHSSWRAQVAAVNALGAIRAKEAVQPLIDYLKVAEGRPRAEARRALVAITYQQYGMDPKGWQEWWDLVKDRWTPPPPKAKDSPVEEGKSDGYGRKPVRYHRLETFSQKIIFVIDISKSMEDKILLKAGKQSDKTDAMTGATRKIDIAREELKATLRAMDPETKFNVVAFETDVRVWQKEPVSATASNVQAAERWMMSQKARSIGGGPVASSGQDSDGYIIGRTNTYAALRTAYGLSTKRGNPKLVGGTTPGSGGKVAKPPFDTCFFLTDGKPTEGEVTDVTEILSEVERWNKTAKMIIHMIGMEEEQGLHELVTGVAKITGGKSIFVGK